MGVLSELEPIKVFKFFEEICNIPHGSGNVKQISDYLVEFAKNRGLSYRQDEKYNVIIFKEGAEGYKESAPVILQDILTWWLSKRMTAIKIWKKKVLTL